MPRRRRTGTAGIPHHVLNRACRRAVLFADADDYRMFLHVLNDARERWWHTTHGTTGTGPLYQTLQSDPRPV